VARKFIVQISTRLSPNVTVVVQTIKNKLWLQSFMSAFAVFHSLYK